MTGSRPDTDATDHARTPRWVRVSWSITVVVIVLFLITLVTKGPHVPGARHGLSGDTGSGPSAGAIGGHTPSPGRLG